ncbi:MAG: amino acid racemase [Parasporobacterium sp.]|nr:amino acid racemase [Parasporobacterium sp.]
MDKKIIGVIGGMGPIATSHFMELVIRMTDAKVDQEHLDMIIYNIPSIPDRTEFILDPSKPNPVPEIIRIGHMLEKAGAEYLCMPCITAHSFMDQLRTSLCRPFINIVEETANYLYREGIRKAGIMATDGTVSFGLFQKAFEEYNIEPCLPSPERQRDVMHIIYQNVKANMPVEMDRFQAVETELKEAGAEAIILGCTELSLVKRDERIGSGFLDGMEVLAQTAVKVCGCKVKEEYLQLITK